MNAAIEPRANTDAIFGEPEHEPLPMGMSYTVKREQMIRDLIVRGREAGILILYAPKGFGKTATLLQYADEVRSDPARGVVCMIEAEDTVAAELMAQLDEVESTTAAAMRPLIAIDNLPCFDRRETDELIDRLRGLRNEGYEIAVTCTPANRAFVRGMGDSVKINAQALRVHPREYSDWARVFTISRTLDVYGLTQGVPELVAALQASVESPDGDADLLQSAAINVMGSVLVELMETRSPLLRLVCMMLLVGDGNISELETCGVRVTAENLSQIARDYPIFGFDPSTQAFSCLGSEANARRRIREIVVARYPDLALKAVRVHMKAGRTDEGVDLAERHLGEDALLEIIQQFPVQIALAGHAQFVSRVLSADSNKAHGRNMGVSACLSVYVSAITIGDYRLARTMCQRIREHASEVEDEVSPTDWSSALAVGESLCSCSGIDLPNMPQDYLVQDSCAAQLLHVHSLALSEMIDGNGRTKSIPFELDQRTEVTALDIPTFLVFSDHLIQEIMSGEFSELNAQDDIFASYEPLLRERRLKPLLDLQRMVIAARRLMSCAPVVDERAFSDAQTDAIRASELGMQLFCMLLEGWQALEKGQVVNAQFRGQQVQKLALGRQSFLKEWGYLLETTAHVRNASRIMLREEAMLLDLVQDDVSPAEAWAVALQLSAVHFDAELSAWYSLHKSSLLEPSFRLFARLAMRALGERSDSVRRLIPLRIAKGYTAGPVAENPDQPLFDAVVMSNEIDLGQVAVTLFGGFRVTRNGHTLTSSIWRRKRCSVLAARLTLEMGAMVGRTTITQELWPNLSYERARENLYVTLSSLRRALGQVAGGPEYILAQGEGLAINKEFVASDVGRFDRLAREVLIHTTGSSGRQVVELCLKMEELYAGPLYVPGLGDTAYFRRMRMILHSKFIDCMIKGASAALDDEDLASASWLVEAALRQDATREDLLRCAMRVYAAEGRQREVSDLYQGHLQYLSRLPRTTPEPETRDTYERIMGRKRLLAV